MAKRLACSACGDDPPFKNRGDWRSLVLSKPATISGPAMYEGLRIVCGACLLPLRIKWMKQSRKVA